MERIDTDSREAYSVHINLGVSNIYYSSWNTLLGHRIFLDPSDSCIA